MIALGSLPAQVAAQFVGFEVGRVEGNGAGQGLVGGVKFAKKALYCGQVVVVLRYTRLELNCTSIVV